MIVEEESSACSAVFSVFNSPFISTNVPREHEVDTGKNFWCLYKFVFTSDFDVYGSFFSYMNVIEVWWRVVLMRLSSLYSFFYIKQSV